MDIVEAMDSSASSSSGESSASTMKIQVPSVSGNIKPMAKWTKKDKETYLPLLKEGIKRHVADPHVMMKPTTNSNKRAKIELKGK